MNTSCETFLFDEPAYEGETAPGGLHTAAQRPSNCSGDGESSADEREDASTSLNVVTSEVQPWSDQVG